MPAQHRRRTTKAAGKAPRTMALPEPGIGGYDYPRGPYGATGFPGSTPAALHRTGHSQGPDGRDDRGRSVQVITAQQDEWMVLPGHLPEGQQVHPPARLHRATAPERREIPRIGGAPGSQNVRNEIAQRYKARPELWRPYRPSPNPGKTGARLTGPSQYHPGVTIHGDPEGAPIPGMPFNPGMTPPLVVVQSRFTEDEGGSQEGYAVNRPLLFAKGGTPPAIPHGHAPHLRGARMSGQRYFGALAQQQQIGLDSDAYGIVRRRGPRHRPLRFEQPAPHAGNYYDVPYVRGEEAPDMIHRSAVRDRDLAVRKPRKGTGRTSRG